MNKNHKIAIIGFGSIGKRHYKNLQSLGFNNIFVYDTDKEKTKVLKEKVLDNLNQRILSSFFIVFICSPNNEHVNIALLASKAGCNIFIEKPLSHNLDGIIKLDKICQQKNLITMVGCNMRFHPCLKFIKKYLEEDKLGKIYSINHEFGYYLPFWRPKQNYSESYSAKKRLGGGIILDDIHEFDLLFWLNNFEEVSDYKIVSSNSGSLKIETEDSAVGVFKFHNGVLGTVRCDYLSKSYVRNCKIVGERGNIFWDFEKNDVILSKKESSKVIFSSRKYDKNRMYVDELKYFFGQIEKKEKSFNDIKIAKKVLDFCVNHD